MVVGASRGLGRGIAAAFADAGSPVLAVARTAQALRDLATGTPGIEAEIAGAADPTVPGALLDRHQPDTVIVVAGASPLMRPLHQHTWETFSADWNTDVRVAFHWLREAPITPLRPGSRVIVASSGAALNGSPLGGGYAGAKATRRFITGYAQDESRRAGLGIAFTAVLPQLTRHRPRAGRRAGLRRLVRAERRAVRRAAWRTAHARRGRRRAADARRHRPGRPGGGLPADRDRSDRAALTQIRADHRWRTVRLGP